MSINNGSEFYRNRFLRLYQIKKSLSPFGERFRERKNGIKKNQPESFARFTSEAVRERDFFADSYQTAYFSQRKCRFRRFNFGSRTVPDAE